MTKTYDVLNMILGLASEAGVQIDPDDVFNSSREAGTITAAHRDCPDMTPWAPAACDLVIKESRFKPIYLAQYGASPYEIACRMRMCAYVASTIMPTTLIDVFGRYSLGIDEDGEVPKAEHIEHWLDQAVEVLAGYLAEYDSSGWIDPHVLAGAVADVHDAARMSMAAHEIGGTDDVTCSSDDEC